MKKSLAILVILAASIFYTPAAQTVTSWYGQECAGRLMSNGKPFRPERLTCASWDYPLGTRLAIRRGGNSVIVVVTDRGPAKRLVAQGRRLDLSEAAFRRIGNLADGLLVVNVEVVK
jgi:rare lipoprotein A